ncbi:ABC transporter transmembrane domain-containing protein [Kineococcus gynurae]|uniref:ABC transporter transmembrane domain-containing protein n=1 Tax=Kineococcus gynurae TaxID=452979 RepID=A0ABV5LRE2_9ACTN
MPARTPRDPARHLLGQVLRRRRRASLGSAAAAVTHQTCEALVPVAIGLTIDRAVSTGDGSTALLAALGILLLFAVLTTAGTLAFWIADVAEIREEHHLRVAVLHRVLTDPGAERGRQSGELLSITTADTRATAAVVPLLSWAVAASAGLVVSAIVLLRVDPGLGAGILLAVPALVLGLQRLAPRLERRVADRQQATGLAAAVAADLLAGLRPLRGIGAVGEASRRYRRASRTSLDASVHAAGANAALAGAGALGVGAILVLTTAVAGWWTLSGRLSVGELVTVVGMASFLADPVRTVTTCVQQLAVARGSAGRVAGLLGADAPPVGAPADPAARLVSDSAGCGPLRRLDLAVGPGELLGVATADVAVADAVTAVLSGAAAPEHGRVHLGGHDLAGLAPATRTASLLAEPHQVHLLGATVGEALDTGRPLDREDVLGAVRSAAALDVLDAHASDGADPLAADLLEDGRNLSGGQRQRLALARALAADRPVLLLRDPTTAVDAVTEDAVAAGLRTARAGRATVVVSTSPPLLARCDRVVFVTADGTSRSGTHQSLLADPGLGAAYAAAVLR